MSFLKKIQFYGGGPLAKEVGDRLRDAGIPIYTMYGTSEYGVMNVILPSKSLPMFVSAGHS